MRTTRGDVLSGSKPEGQSWLLVVTLPPTFIQWRLEFGRLLMPSRVVMATVRGAGPSMECSAADRLVEREQCPIREFTAQVAVEAFDEGVLHWLAGRDVMPGDLVILGKA